MLETFTVIATPILMMAVQLGQRLQILQSVETLLGIEHTLRELKLTKGLAGSEQGTYAPTMPSHNSTLISKICHFRGQCSFPDLPRNPRMGEKLDERRGTHPSSKRHSGPAGATAVQANLPVSQLQ